MDRTILTSMFTGGLAGVLFGCFLLTVFVDMVAGVSTGLVLALFFHLRQRRKKPPRKGGSKTAHDEEKSVEELFKK